jgi:ABC-type transporter Mla subunit MlaD
MADHRARRLVGLSFGAVVLVIVAILFVGSHYGIIVGQTQSWPHSIQTVVPTAFEVTPGERMVAGGTTVGEITKAEVTRSGQAHVVMGLNDAVWPLPADSVLTLRMGGTIKYTDRFIAIAKGRAQSSLADNAYLPAGQFVVPVEYASLFNVFDGPTRASLRSLFANGGPTFQAAAKPLRSALNVAPPVLTNASAVFADLGYDQQALSTLVSSTAQVTKAVADSNPGLRTLIDGAAGTFSSVASQSTQLKQIVQGGAPWMHIQGILYYHLAREIPQIAQLAERLRPGANQLDQLAAPLNSTLQEIVNVEPTAVHTLQTVTKSGPSLDSFLTKARTELLPQLASAGNQAATELNCIRPYTPEIVNTLQGWGGWQSNGLNQPHMKLFHALASLLPFPGNMPINTQQLSQILPGLTVNVPAAPGLSWNQPWYQPQCGITAAQTSAAGDSENNTYAPNDGGKLAPFNSTSPVFK